MHGRVQRVPVPRGHVPVLARVRAHVEQTVAVEALVAGVRPGAGRDAIGAHLAADPGARADGLEQGRVLRRVVIAAVDGRQARTGRAVCHGRHVVDRARVAGIAAVF